MKKKLSQKTMDHLKHLREIQTHIADNPKKNLREVMEELNLDYQTHRGMMTSNERYKAGINYARSPKGAKRIKNGRQTISKMLLVGSDITPSFDKNGDIKALSCDKENLYKKEYKKGLCDGIVIAVFSIIFLAYLGVNFYSLVR